MTLLGPTHVVTNELHDRISIELTLSKPISSGTIRYIFHLIISMIHLVSPDNIVQFNFNSWKSDIINKCLKCGANIYEPTSFCPKCGVNIDRQYSGINNG